MSTLTEKQAQYFLDRNWGNVATLREDGTPHVTPVWVDWDGEEIVFNTVVGRMKERHLRRDPRVAIEVFKQENPQAGYVSVTGRAELEEEGADAHIDKLARKYLDEDVYPNRQPGERRVIVRITPERVNAYGDASE